MDKLSRTQVLSASPVKGFHFWCGWITWFTPSVALKHLRASFLPFSGTWLRCLFPQPRQWDLNCSLDVPVFFFPGHLRHRLNYVPVIQGDLGHLTCHLMLHNYIPDPGFQHLKSSKPRWGDCRLSFFVVPLWFFGQRFAATQSESKKTWLWILYILNPLIHPHIIYYIIQPLV